MKYKLIKPLLLFCSLFFMLSSFLVSCDMLNSMPENDLQKKMDEQIAWTNAPRIAVTVLYPQEWGSSPQSGTGRCLDDQRNEAPRMGYVFTVQFDPSHVYGNAHWRAYRTSDLNNLPVDWSINTVSITEALDNDPDAPRPLRPERDISFSTEGNKSSVKVYINEAVTLVPWCYKQPRIIMSNPPLNSTYNNYRRDPNREITVTFAAPVDKNTLIFGEDYIEIKARASGTFSEDMESYFIAPLIYDEATYTLTIQSKGNIPTGKVMRVKLGVNIKSPDGYIGMDEVTFSYRTTTDSIFINTWQSIYDENSNSITVEWKLPPNAADMQPAIRYQVNDGSIIPVDVPLGTNILTIEGVPHINDSGVKDGYPASNFYGYTIFLALGDEPAVIRIWNVPGMVVRKNWGNGRDKTINVIEISSVSDLEIMSYGVYWDGDESIDKIYVLTEDLSLPSPWLPIGNEYNFFQGKFYGNGHTITIGRGFKFESTAYTGIFGIAKNAEIRDLCINYSVPVTVTADDNERTGGLAADVEGNTVIRNCIIKGTKLSVTSASESYVDLGGMVGFMTSGVSISNCFVDLDAELNKLNVGSAYIGGIAAYIIDGTVVSPSEEMLSNIRVVGDVTCFVNNAAGSIYGGGIVGYCNSDGGKMRNLSYGGTLTLGRENYIAYDDIAENDPFLFGGGIVGSCIYPELESCEFSGTIKIENDNSEEAIIGGIAGELNGDGSLSDCVARGRIDIESEKSIFAGGAIGYLAGTGSADEDRIHVSNCAYKGESFEVKSGYNAERTFVGGFIGALYRFGSVKNCLSDAAPVTVDVSSGFHYFGGFAGYIFASDVANCGNNSPIEMTGQTDEPVVMGGFTGLLSANSKEESDELYPVVLENCWSKGPVSSSGAGDLYIGALIGSSEGGSGVGESNGIIRCYATGNVSAMSSSNDGIEYDEEFNEIRTYIVTGGLVGYADYTDISESWASGNVEAEQSTYGDLWNEAGGLVGYICGGSIVNCYALGEVVVDNPKNTATDLAAGGLVGGMWDSDVKYCFAGGDVTARSAGNGEIYAGGIAGYKKEDEAVSAISHSVALGASVTVEGWNNASAKGQGRIYGCSEGSGISDYNYAYIGMELLRSATYGNSVTGIPVTGGTLASPDGLDTIINAFRKMDFWLDVGGLSFNYIGGGIGGIKPYWGFSGLEGRGYPILAWQ